MAPWDFRETVELALSPENGRIASLSKRNVMMKRKAMS